MLTEDEARQNGREDDLEVEQERRGRGGAPREPPEKQRRREDAPHQNDCGQDPSIAERQRPARGRPAAPNEPRQAEEHAGAEIQQPGEEQRRHDGEKQLRERRAEPEGERGDQRFEDRHGDARPLYSTARLDRVTADRLAHPAPRRAYPRATRHRAVLQRLAAGGGAPDAHEQPRPRRRGAVGGPRRLRRGGAGGPPPGRGSPQPGGAPPAPGPRDAPPPGRATPPPGS